MGYRIRKLEIRNKDTGMQEFAKIGSTLPGQRIMTDKIFPLALKVKDLNPHGANILKQEMLSRAGDVVTSRDSLIQDEGLTDVIILGTEKSVRSLAEKIKMQPFGLKKLAAELEEYLDFLGMRVPVSAVKIGKKIFDTINNGPIIMGILNVTDDSFFDGGKYLSENDMRQRVEAVWREGGHIIDIGGLSTRPGSRPVSAEEEMRRVLPAIDYVRSFTGQKDLRMQDYKPGNGIEPNKCGDIIVSCDTYRSEVARAAIKAGAEIINDISGLTFDGNMPQLLAETGASVVIMHIKGTPENMQKNPHYDDVIDEIYEFLYKQTDFAIKSGVQREKIIIDPGIGFGKTLEHNLKIIRRLPDFVNMGFPVMVGASRKSFIGNILGETICPRPAGQRLEGSLAAAVCSYINGASILRVHDVKQTCDALKIASAIKNQK